MSSSFKPFQKYLLGLSFASFSSFLAFFLVLSKLDPYESPVLGLIFFYLSLFFALSSLFTVLGFYFRRWLTHNEIIYAHFNVSLRQGGLLSLTVVLCLLFQMFHVLTWWSGLLLLSLIVLLEFYLTSSE